MAATGTMLRVLYGESANLPSGGTTATDGSMYVVTSNNAKNSIYDAALYFDLGTKRYQIQANTAAKLEKTVTLQLNGANVGNSFDGSTDIIWDIPLATADQIGLLSTGAQTFAGAKTFSNAATFNSTIAVKNTATMRTIEPEATNNYTLGSSNKKWSAVYATEFNGDLVGNADTATQAASTAGTLTTENLAGTQTNSFNGSGNVSLSLSDFISQGETLPLSMIPQGALERIVTYASQAAAQTALDNNEIQPGDLVQIGESGVMYYVKETVSNGVSTWSLAEFYSGVAAKASSTVGTLTMSINDVSIATFNGSGNASFDVPYATQSAAGLVSTTTQTFNGAKTFLENVSLSKALSVTGATTLSATATTQSIEPSTTNIYDLGANNKKWNTVYATTFNGDLTGTATSASATVGSLSFVTTATGASQSTFNGSGNVTLGTFVPSTSETGGAMGFVPAPGVNYTDRILRGDGTWSQISGSNGISINSTNGFTISHTNSVTASTLWKGQSANVAGNIGTGEVSFSIPALTYDAQGHITNTTVATVTLEKLNVTQILSQGLKVATIGNTDIYSGVEWETFV